MPRIKPAISSRAGISVPEAPPAEKKRWASSKAMSRLSFALDAPSLHSSVEGQEEQVVQDERLRTLRCPAHLPVDAELCKIAWTPGETIPSYFRTERSQGSTEAVQNGFSGLSVETLGPSNLLVEVEEGRPPIGSAEDSEVLVEAVGGLAQDAHRTRRQIETSMENV